MLELRNEVSRAILLSSRKFGETRETGFDSKQDAAIHVSLALGGCFVLKNTAVAPSWIEPVQCCEYDYKIHL